MTQKPSHQAFTNPEHPKDLWMVESAIHDGGDGHLGFQDDRMEDMIAEIGRKVKLKQSVQNKVTPSNPEFKKSGF